MAKALVLVPLSRGAVDDAAWELASAARAAAGADASVVAVLLGQGVAGPAEAAARRFDEVLVLDDPRFAAPDGEAHGAVLAALAAREKPAAVVLLADNHAMDLAPALSVRLGAPLLTDALEIAAGPDGVSAVRAVYGGKVRARYVAAPSPAGVVITVRPGAFPAAPERGAAGPVRSEAPPAGLPAKRRFVRTVPRDPGEVDITQAERLVAVGRGLGDPENLAAVQELAGALGAEVACSRPVVDKRWLPKSRQVGTSGASVKPKVYLALGISGSFQHLGGLKGRPFLAAVNKDPRAPIFGVADVGVVADLVEFVPLLTARLRPTR